MNGNGHPNRLELEQRAERLRSRLADTLGELDRRRHEMFDLRLQARRHPLPLELITAGLVVTAAGATALVVYRIVQVRQRSRWRGRLLLLGQVLARPERFLRPPEPPVLSVRRVLGLGREALGGLLSLAAAEIGRRLVSSLLMPRAGAPASPSGAGLQQAP